MLYANIEQKKTAASRQAGKQTTKRWYDVNVKHLIQYGDCFTRTEILLQRRYFVFFLFHSFNILSVWALYSVPSSRPNTCVVVVAVFLFRANLSHYHKLNVAIAAFCTYVSFSSSLTPYRFHIFYSIWC